MTLLAHVGENGSYLRDVLPGMLVAGLGLGVAVVAVSIAILTGAREDETGMISGLNSTGHEIGGTVGIAIFSTIAAGSGAIAGPQAATGIAHAFVAAALLASVASLVALAVLRRADAERSVAAILDAALEALASDPDSSMAEIARRAGVVRATIYVHFPTRESLLDAVMERSVADVARATRDAEPQRGEPTEALERVLRATWRELDRFHDLLAINTARLSAAELHRRHLPVLEQLAPLIERGQKDGSFRSDLSVAWHLAVIRAIVHATSNEIQGGRLAESEAEAAMLSTAIAAISERPPSVS
jgi:AcrR family transcriptional regulator